MLTFPDFKEKQILFIDWWELKDLLLRNDNLMIYEKEKVIDEKTWKEVEKKKLKNQITLFKIFSIFIIWNFTITSSLIKKLDSFWISVFFLNKNFSVYSAINSSTEWNFLLRKKQYFEENDLEIAKILMKNKAINQIALLKKIRWKSDKLKKIIKRIEVLFQKIDSAKENEKLMWIEWNISKLFFQNYYWEIWWIWRKPRAKEHEINLLLDIWYTYLFNFIEVNLRLYGFDVYYWVYHRLFYQRKSLVCDIIEPFRCIIDKATLKIFNLKQIDKKDFKFQKWQFQLDWRKSRKYTKFYLEAIMENKEEIFLFIQKYYRKVMKWEKNENNFLIK